MIKKIIILILIVGLATCHCEASRSDAEAISTLAPRAAARTKTISALAEDLKNPKWQDRLKAIKNLKRTNLPDIIPFLIGALRDDMHLVRLEAIAALEIFPEESTLELLATHIVYLQSELEKMDATIVRRNLYWDRDRHTSVLIEGSCPNPEYKKREQEIGRSQRAYFAITRRICQRDADETEVSGQFDDDIVQRVKSAIKTGQVTDIRDERLRKFQEFLKDHNLDEHIVIIGGGARDSLFGRELHDIDITVRMGLNETDRNDFTRTAATADENVFHYCKGKISALATALGTTADELLYPSADDSERVTFEGLEISYCGPIPIEIDQRRVIRKRIIVDCLTGELFSDSGPGLLTMAIDADSNLYGYTEVLRNALGGQVGFIGDEQGIALDGVVRLLRLKYDLGLEIDGHSYAIMQQTIDGYNKSDIPFSTIIVPVVEKQLAIIRQAAEREGRVEEAEKELLRLGIDILLYNDQRDYEPRQNPDPLRSALAPRAAHSWLDEDADMAEIRAILREKDIALRASFKKIINGNPHLQYSIRGNSILVINTSNNQELLFLRNGVGEVYVAYGDSAFIEITPAVFGYGKSPLDIARLNTAYLTIFVDLLPFFDIEMGAFEPIPVIVDDGVPVNVIKGTTLPYIYAALGINPDHVCEVIREPDQITITTREKVFRNWIAEIEAMGNAIGLNQQQFESGLREITDTPPFGLTPAEEDIAQRTVSRAREHYKKGAFQAYFEQVINCVSQGDDYPDPPLALSAEQKEWLEKRIQAEQLCHETREGDRAFSAYIEGITAAADTVDPAKPEEFEAALAEALQNPPEHEKIQQGLAGRAVATARGLFKVRAQVSREEAIIAYYEQIVEQGWVMHASRQEFEAALAEVQENHPQAAAEADERTVAQAIKNARKRYAVLRKSAIELSSGSVHFTDLTAAEQEMINRITRQRKQKMRQAINELKILPISKAWVLWHQYAQQRDQLVVKAMSYGDAPDIPAVIIRADAQAEKIIRKERGLKQKQGMNTPSFIQLYTPIDIDGATITFHPNRENSRNYFVSVYPKGQSSYKDERVRIFFGIRDRGERGATFLLQRIAPHLPMASEQEKALATAVVGWLNQQLFDDQRSWIIERERASSDEVSWFYEHFYNVQFSCDDRKRWLRINNEEILAKLLGILTPDFMRFGLGNNKGIILRGYPRPGLVPAPVHPTPAPAAATSALAVRAAGENVDWEKEYGAFYPVEVLVYPKSDEEGQALEKFTAELNAEFGEWSNARVAELVGSAKQEAIDLVARWFRGLPEDYIEDYDIQDIALGFLQDAAQIDFLKVIIENISQRKALRLQTVDEAATTEQTALVQTTLPGLDIPEPQTTPAPEQNIRTEARIEDDLRARIAAHTPSLEPETKELYERYMAGEISLIGCGDQVRAMLFYATAFDNNYRDFLAILLSRIEDESDEDGYRFVEKLSELQKTIQKTCQWDFVNRFPGAAGINAFRGTGVEKEGRQYVPGKTLNVNKIFFTHRPALSTTYGALGWNVISAYIPVQSIIHTSWAASLDTIEEKYEMELCAEGEITILDTYMVDARFAEWKLVCVAEVYEQILTGLDPILRAVDHEELEPFRHEGAHESP